jgi:hypothetical protein
VQRLSRRFADWESSDDSLELALGQRAPHGTPRLLFRAAKEGQANPALSCRKPSLIVGPTRVPVHGLILAARRLPVNPRTSVEPSDPLIRALARFVEVLDERYPRGPDELPKSGLAFDGNEGNMRTVLDDEGPSAA